MSSICNQCGRKLRAKGDGRRWCASCRKDRKPRKPVVRVPITPEMVALPMPCTPPKAIRASARQQPIYRCNRCDRLTVEELTEVDDEFLCGRCVAREPELTEEEILRRAKEIRLQRDENWQMDRLNH